MVESNQDNAEKSLSKETIKVLEETSMAAKATEMEKNPGMAREAGGATNVNTTLPGTEGRK